MTLPAERSSLPAGAGMNTIQLELALTREELARTMDQLFSKFNPRLRFEENPGGIMLFALAGAVIFGRAVIRIRRRKRQHA